MFAKRLSKLPMLHAAHFGSETEKMSVQKRLDEEVLVMGHFKDDSQLQHFNTSGEVAKLLKLCSSRFDSIFAGANVGKNAAHLVADWFVFDPTAYALTYELEKNDPLGYAVVLATPTLRGVYSNDIGFKDEDGVATFLDSILIHEAAHCVGSMKHDTDFKLTFKKICELERVKPVT